MGYGWVTFQKHAQALIWAACFIVYVSMGLTSERGPGDYARKWWLEGIICLTWIPFIDLGVGLEPQTVMYLMYVGMVAHLLRIIKWVAARFSHLAVVVIGLGTVLMVFLCSGLLMVVEPQTYPNLDETAFSVYMSAHTLGPLKWPVTTLGRVIFYFITTAGVTITALMIAVMREYVQRLFGHKDVSQELLNLLKDVHKAVTAGGADVQSQQTIAEQKRVIAEQEETIKTLRGAVNALLSKKTDEPPST
jgi:hypothetical protein